MKKKKKSVIVVEVWEHDRWSGPEKLDAKVFRTRSAAERFCVKKNSGNTLPQAPDYYIEAHITSDSTQ